MTTTPQASRRTAQALGRNRVIFSRLATTSSTATPRETNTDLRKPLDKQKEGKKRMRQYGNVDIPQEAFIAALRMGDDN